MSTDTFELSRWSLADLLPATKGPELEQVLSELETAIAELEAGRELLSPDLPEAEFQRLLGLVETLSALASRLEAYSYLWFASDTQDQEALAFRGRIDNLLADVRNRTLFFSLWWKGLDDGPAGRLLAASGDDAHYLATLRQFKPHTLSEPEEKVINLKDVNGGRALRTLYNMLTSELTFKLEVDGEVKELTRTELTPYIMGPSPELRAAAYQELYRVFGERRAVLSQIYQHIVRDWASENLTLRHFASPISVRNLLNDIPDPVADTLLEVCRRNAGLFQRYFRLKAGWLGVDKLRRYDIYAPISASTRTYSFDEGARMALDSLHDFSPTLAQLAKRVFDDDHLDSEVRPRKDTGAFCYGVVPGLTPWVQVNYNGLAS